MAPRRGTSIGPSPLIQSRLHSWLKEEANHSRGLGQHLLWLLVLCALAAGLNLMGGTRGADSKGSARSLPLESPLPALALTSVLMLGFRANHLLRQRGRRLEQLKVSQGSRHQLRRIRRQLEQLRECPQAEQSPDLSDGVARSLALESTQLETSQRETIQLGSVQLESIQKELGLLVRQSQNRERLDALTQLPNRSSLLEALAVPLPGQRQMLISVEIDHVAALSQSYGPGKADALMLQASRRLGELVLPGGLLARSGASSFALLQPHGFGGSPRRLNADTEALALATMANQLLSGPIQLDELTLELSTSIGISVSLDGLEGGHGLLQRSEAALAKARSSSHRRLAFSTGTIAAEEVDAFPLYLDLMQAIRNGNLQVVFQPIVNAKGETRALEALARWHHPRLGTIPTEQFLAWASQYRQMGSVGDALMELALAEARPLLASHPQLSLAINVAPCQLGDSRFSAKLASHLGHHRLEPQRLTLEITEQGVLESDATVEKNLEAIRALGCRLSLDDFGTGFSSLSLLRRLNPHEVKIDRSFVLAMTEAGHGSEIVGLVVSMAQRMQLAVVAEGVEDAAAMQRLESLGIRRFQGFHFARPMAAGELSRLLSQPLAGIGAGPGSPSLLAPFTTSLGAGAQTQSGPASPAPPPASGPYRRTVRPDDQAA